VTAGSIEILGTERTIITTTLVTGGTGQLGSPTVALLREAGHEVRVLSRRRGEGLATGELVSGTGIREALEHVHTVIHLASTGSSKDVDAAHTLIDASKKAGVEHLVLISIVGVDDIPLGYYRAKAESERLLRDSGLPHTILRATQFHSFVDTVYRLQRFLPVLFAPKLSFQPIAVEEVAERLVELATASPAGRVADIGGPERRTARELGELWRDATGSRRAIVPLSMPGRTFAGYAAGHNLVPGVPYGRRTFSQYLAERH
jgi:uncharacterized protein YbjT (DUF2867 family)